LSIRPPKKLQRELKAMASVVGKSESELVREALEEYMQRNVEGPSCYDIAKKAGWIGCIKDGPPDLGTNPKYMEGFGRD
jgi:metal-responsive CopG/Arc/MetJ family transcriptional regulator